MKKIFSNSWKSSTQARKQRKYRANAPTNVRKKFMSAPLSKELRKKYNLRSIRIKKGDKIKITRGKNKGSVGKVEKVDLKNEKVTISGIEMTKKDGTKKHLALNPSNVIIIEPNTEDKFRNKKLAQKTKNEESKK